MRKNPLILVLGVISLLCLSWSARAVVPITITGPGFVCSGNSGAYTVTPTAGYHYVWSVTAQGNITGANTGPSINVLWGTPGTATVTINGFDGSNVLQEVGTLTVNVEPIPSPYITADKIAGCQNYADTPTKGRQEGAWVPGDPHILDDGNGCPKVCDSSVVVYTANGPAGSTFGWSVSGGTIIGLTSNTCTVYWTGPVGFGSITLYDTSAYGCVGTKTVCINIIEKPHALYATQTTICLGQTATFLDQSTYNPTSPIINWYYDFGDGNTFTTSSSTTITHDYTSPGTYPVMLVVRNQCGCTDTFVNKVIVNPDSGVTISCHGVVCDSSTATYTLNPPVSCSSYHWTVQGGTIISGAGTPTITVFWNHVDATGFGTIVFNPSGCSIHCPSPTVIRIPVVNAHGHISGPNIVCPYSQYLYNLPQWPTTTFNWTVLSSTGATVWPTDQNNQIALNTHGAGTIVLKCVYQNTMLGCGGTAYDTIQVVSPDSIVGPALQCLNSTGFYHLGSGSTGTWTLTYPDNSTFTNVTSSFSAPFNQVGTYQLTVTGSFCLSNPLTIKVGQLPPAPDSLLGPDTACFGVPVDFEAKNSMAGSIFGWAAVTGSPATANGDHATFSFSGSSPATVMVWRETMDDAHCHSDTLSKLVYKPFVNPHVTGADTVCPNTSYTYNAGYAGVEAYHWTVYDPLKGSVQNDGDINSTILFNNLTGPVDIIVNVTKCGTDYPDTLHVYIRPLTPPSISALPNPVCRDVPVHAILTSGGTGATSIAWDWGDGTTTMGSPSDHAYTSLSATNLTYTLGVTVTNPYGCPGTVTANTTITVLPAPVANVTPVGPFFTCTPPSQPLTATLSAGYAPTDSLLWVSAPGTIVSGCGLPLACNPYPVTSYGTYFAIAISANHCRDTSNYVVFDTCHPQPSCTIAGSPYADIDAATVNCGAVHLHGSYASFPTAFSWNWVSPSQAHSVTTTNTTLDCSFDLAGAYTFTYIVGFTDASHDTCYVQGDTSIIVPFIAGMKHSVTCAGSGYNVTMYNQSNYYPGHEPRFFSYYVDGGYITSDSSGTHTVFLPGDGATHTLNMWEYYGPGTHDSCLASDNVFLDSLPHASFTFARDTTCIIDASVQFTNHSSPASGWTSLWDFGDGTGNTQTNPWKVYGATGPYFATLTVTNEYGCSDDTTEYVPLILQQLSGNVSGDSIACAGSVVTIMYNSSGLANPEQYYWMNGVDTMYMTTSGTTNVYTSGSYWVIGTDHYGCFTHTPPMNRQSVTFITPPPATITGDSSACINVPYTLNGYAGSDPSIGYTWIKNNVVVGHDPSYTDPATSIGTFTYYLVVSIANPLGGSCTDTSAPFVVTVHSLPAPPSITDGIVDCNTYTIKLSAIGPSYGTYNWSNSMFGQNITVPEGGGPYKVWYTDTFGCVSSASIMVPRDPRLYLWMFPVGCYNWCISSLPRTIVGPIEPFNYWAYLMDPGTIVSSGSGTPVGSYAVTGPGDYQLILKNAFCTDTSGVLDVTVDKDCIGCKQIMFKPVKVFQTGCDPVPPAMAGAKTTAADTCCHNYIVIQFTNSGTAIGVNLSVTNGSLAPSGTLAPTGTSSSTFQFIPAPGFNGGTVVITMTYTDPRTGQIYTCQQKVDIPPCGQGNKGTQEETGSNIVTSPDGLSAIRLVPNPAQNSTRVDYSFNGDATGSYIEVYDMVGRLMARHELNTVSGSWQVPLDGYAPGIYQVVLRQQGKPILQSRLSVVR